jgi:N-methylhydantoinase A
VPERLLQADRHIAQAGQRMAYFGPEYEWLETAVLSRSDLMDACMPGPVIIEEYDTTTVVGPGWRVRLGDWNNIFIER